LKALLYVSNGVRVSRDVYAELSRRMKERGATDEAVAILMAAGEEFESELQAYLKTLPE
jgi:hypothetical protein